MQDRLTKLNNKKYCSRVMRNAIDDLQAMGAIQLETFVSYRLVVRYQFHKKITLTHFSSVSHFYTL